MHRLLLALVLLLAGCATPTSNVAPPASRPPAPAVQSAGPPTAPAAPAALETARVVSTSLSLGAAPIYLARDLGYWAAEGIDGEIIYVAGAATPAQALVAGEVDFVGGAGASTVPPSLAGASLTVIAVHMNTFPFTIMSPTLQSMDELKDKRLGITRRGAASDFAARYALRHVGLQADRDVTLVPLEGTPELVTGLAVGAADAGLLTELGIVQTRRLGYHELLNVASLGVEYSQTGLDTTTRLVTERPDFVRRVVRGWSRALAFFLTNPDESLPLLARHLRVDDPSIMQEAYRDYAPIVQRVPYPRPGGIQTVLDLLAPTTPAAATAKPESFITDHFVRELDEAGFFKALYGN
jgi:NitT/TauT family transport system substrate-binding protein